jgi:hypothetical protein
LIAAYFVALVVFGKSFTKLQVAGPLYLHDLILLFIVVFSLVFQPRIRIHSGSLFILLLIACGYLVYDLIRLRHDSELFIIAIRQFAPFLYLACCLIIFGTQVRDQHASLKAISLIRFIGNLSLLLQCIFLAYGLAFTPGFSFTGQSDYNYFSPLVIMGIITYCADVLSNDEGPVKKSLKFIFGMAIALTLGHSSAFLAVFIILMLYAYIRIKPIQRLLSFVFIIAAVLSLFLLPQFTDFNAGWRLLYWKHILQRSVVDGYLILGHGFGDHYMTDEYARYVDRVLDSKGMIDQYYPMASYLNPPHNSILTIVFHVGLIPALLFFVPLIRFFKQMFFEKLPDDKNVMFLILALSGNIVWICFNVILELPHSATYFWLIFFTTVFYLKNTRQREESDDLAVP